MNPLMLAVAATCAIFTSTVLGADLGGLVDPKMVDQMARDKLGVKTNANDPSDVAIPLTGNPSDADEEALGREIAGRLLGASPLVKDDKLQQYVNKVGRYVAAQSSRPELNWTFGVIETPTVNAFAAPGGYVFITRGLYAKLKSEAELAGVLGHEIAHVNARHHVRLLQKERLASMGKELLLKGAKNDSVKALVGNGAEVFSRKLDKDSEFEADRMGVVYAARAGYDVYGLAAVLDRLDVEGATDQVSLLFKTHPLPADRIAALDKAIGDRFDKLPAGATLPTRLAKLPPEPVAPAPAASTGAAPAGGTSTSTTKPATTTGTTTTKPATTTPAK